MMHTPNQTLRKRKGVKKLIIDAALTKLFFRHAHRSSITSSALISMSDASSSMSLSDPVISLARPSHPSFFLSPLSFHPDEDFRLLDDITCTGVPSIYLQESTPTTPTKSLDSYFHLLPPATTSDTEMEPSHDDAGLPTSSLHSPTSHISTFTSESQPSSPITFVASTEIVSRTGASAERYTPHPSLEDSCVESAKQMGIKVRDFAYEDHGVKTAPAVNELDVLKAEYLRHRLSGRTPPRETTETLRFADSKWFEVQDQKFANGELPSLASTEERGGKDGDYVDVKLLVKSIDNDSQSSC